MAQTEKKAVTVRRVRDRMTFSFTILMMLVVFFGATYIYMNLKRTTEQRYRDILAASGIRIAASVDSFTAEAEADCTAALSSEEIASFDPITGIHSAEDLAQLRSAANERLMKLSAGRNYNDFFMLYNDSTTVGKVSGGIRDLVINYGSEMFFDKLGDEADCWVYSSVWSDKRLFYLRRMSDHSLFMMSCYLSELDGIFGDVHFDTSNYYLCGENNVILFSSLETLSPGKLLPNEISGFFDDLDGYCSVIDGVVTSSTTTDSGWHVIITTESPIPNLSLSLVIVLSVIIGTAIVILCWLMGVVSSANFVLAEIMASGDEFIDPITGRYNEYGLDERISEKLETSLVGSTYAFLLIRVQDAEQIRTAVTNKCWTDICTKLITISEEYFSDRKFIVGRMQNDRIVLFVDFSEFDIFKAHRTLEQSCKDFAKAFDGMTAGDDNALRLHVDIGASVYPDHAEDFDTLLEKAAKALGDANKKDGDSFVLYDPSKHESEEMK